jgi:hypothetical protein
MKAGDWVRFRTDVGGFLKELPEWKHGLLVEYHTWEKIARILYEGKIVSMRAENVQLAVRAPENI